MTEFPTPRDVPRPPAWLAEGEKSTPLWLRTLYSALPVSAVTVIHGGIHDLHPLPVEGGVRPDTTINAIWRVLESSGFDALLTFDPLNGLQIACTTSRVTVDSVRQSLIGGTDRRLVANLLKTPAERAVEVTEQLGSSEVTFVGMDALVHSVAQSRDPAIALVIDYTSQMQSRREDGETDDSGLHNLMLASRVLADTHALLNGHPIRFPRDGHSGLVRNPVIWLVDRPGDLPRWLSHGDGIRQIPIPAPDVDDRLQVARLLVNGRVAPEQVESVASRLADSTEGFTTRGLFETVQLVGPSNDLARDIESVARTYRQGLSENPWQSQRLREQLASGEEVLKRRVTGQDAAVEKVLDILKRSALGLTSAHQAKDATAPRGVLYFAGPTGVGKTEMTKAIAELVFADERALIRFDMSEFQDNHAKARLIGAPPGYVGYGQGGELTNALQQRPQSIVLFDEMDKAGKEVNDLFLQILSDGRLTDSAGRTTYFNESLIIFTSNQGVSAVGDLLTLDLTVPENLVAYEERMSSAVKDHFRNTLGRPEILGRLGDNIVIFRPMQGEVAKQLANKFIDTILANVRRRVDHEVAITENALAALIAASTDDSDLASGGRGITTALETLLVNPLGRILFDLETGKTVTISGLRTNGDGTVDLEHVVE